MCSTNNLFTAYYFIMHFRLARKFHYAFISINVNTTNCSRVATITDIIECNYNFVLNWLISSSCIIILIEHNQDGNFTVNYNNRAYITTTKK